MTIFHTYYKLICIGIGVTLMLSSNAHAYNELNLMPLCTVKTPNSILQSKSNYQPMFVGDRARYATCTGVAWFHTDYLAVLNLYGQKIDVYKFHAESLCFEHIQEMNNDAGAKLTNSSNIAISPDGTLLALSSGEPKAGLKLYTLNLETHTINPEPVAVVNTSKLLHNVRFSPDNRYVATTGFDDEEAVCIYKLVKNDKEIKVDRIFAIKSLETGMRAKGINFTQDGKFAVVVSGKTKVLSKSLALKNPTNAAIILTTYAFDAESGILTDTVCNVCDSSFKACCEDIVLAHNDTLLLLSNQNNDSLLMYNFNPNTGSIGSLNTILKGTNTQLDFPHGLSISSDNRYLAVSNFGSDAFNLYDITEITKQT